MKILCCDPNGGGFKFITRSYGRAFKKLGHEFMFWDGNHRTWHNYSPDLYIGCSGHKQDIPINRGKCKVAIHVNPICNESMKLYGVDINESQEAASWVYAQNPDAVFGFAFEEELKKYWGGWNFKLIPMPTAADCVSDYKVEPVEEYRCDVGFVGGRWKYKAHMLDKYIVPLFGKFDVKIYGWGGWDVSAYKGPIKDENFNSFYSSSTVVPAITEPHTETYNIDLPERVFKAPMAGSCAISNYFASHKIFGSTLPIVSSEVEIIETVSQLVARPKDAHELGEEQRKIIKNSHTYVHRVSRLLEEV